MRMCCCSFVQSSSNLGVNMESDTHISFFTTKLVQTWFSLQLVPKTLFHINNKLQTITLHALLCNTNIHTKLN